MRLANDLIAVTDGHGHSVRLRPSLRAAVRLHAKHGLPDLVEKIGTGHLGAMADTLVEATDSATAQHLVDALRHEGVRTLESWREPLVEFVFALLSIDRSSVEHDRPADQSPDAINRSIDKHLETLFEIGTGWLGWSPSATWAATPSEILIAQRGHIAKLKLLNGVVDEPDRKYDPREEISPEQVQAGIAALKAEALRGKAA